MARGVRPRFPIWGGGHKGWLIDESAPYLTRNEEGRAICLAPDSSIWVWNQTSITSIPPPLQRISIPLIFWFTKRFSLTLCLVSTRKTCLPFILCCLEEDKLRPGEFYRYGEAIIGPQHGYLDGKIDECMDTLFSYVDKTLGEEGNPQKRSFSPISAIITKSISIPISTITAKPSKWFPIGFISLTGNRLYFL